MIVSRCRDRHRIAEISACMQVETVLSEQTHECEASPSCDPSAERLELWMIWWKTLGSQSGRYLHPKGLTKEQQKDDGSASSWRKKMGDQLTFRFVCSILSSAGSCGTTATR